MIVLLAPLYFSHTLLFCAWLRLGFKPCEPFQQCVIWRRMEMRRQIHVLE